MSSILRSYASRFAEAPRGTGDLAAFDSCSALASGAGTDPGACGLHHEYDAAGWNGAAGSGAWVWQRVRPVDRGFAAPRTAVREPNAKLGANAEEHHDDDKLSRHFESE
jgi:hypothetical protein